MTARDWDNALHRFHPLLPCQALGQALIPLPSMRPLCKTCRHSRAGGNLQGGSEEILSVVLDLFTLTFDSSPIKETFAKPTVIPA